MVDKDFEGLKPEDRLGAQPIEQQFKKLMIATMKTIDGFFNPEGVKETGIVMFVFPYRDAAGRVNYISNGANRSDVCRLLEEQLIRFKTDRDDDGPIIEAIADAIERVMLSEFPPMTLKEQALAAAALAITIYRDPPEKKEAGDDTKG